MPKRLPSLLLAAGLLAAPSPATAQEAPDSAALRAFLHALETRLATEPAVGLDYRVAATGAFSAELRGRLEMGAGETVRLTGTGSFGGAPMELHLESDGTTMRWSRNGEAQEAPAPPHLREAVAVGFVRMGILHNLARLTAGSPPDHADGGVAQWVEVDALTGRPDEATGVGFDITVAGQPSGSARLAVLDRANFGFRRTQTVRFPGGEMQVTEWYGPAAGRAP